MGFGRIGKKLSHSTHKIGKKISHSASKIGKKLSAAEKVGRTFENSFNQGLHIADTLVNLADKVDIPVIDPLVHLGSQTLHQGRKLEDNLHNKIQTYEHYKEQARKIKHQVKHGDIKGLSNNQLLREQINKYRNNR